MNEQATAQDLLPVRMLNEYAYCPRLFHLMHVEGRMEVNEFVAEGRHVHRRVDKLDHVLPDADGDDKPSEGPDDGDEPPEISRSVPLGSESLGLTAKLDLVSTDGHEALPVETKRGRVPKNAERSWEPERVQLMAQGLLLREHGYDCTHGMLYFAGSRTRVRIEFSPELEAATLRYLSAARAAAQTTVLPPPLNDSPKCNGCSLAGICLPDETLSLRDLERDPADEIRRFYPARDEALPFYVQEQGARVGKDHRSLTVRKSGETLTKVGLKNVSHLVLCGNIGISAQALHFLCEASVPVVHLSMGHWFYGITQGISVRNGYARSAQYRVASDPELCRRFAAELVSAKVRNQRTLLRRNGDPPPSALRELAGTLGRGENAADLGELLGIEGTAARVYFQHFATMFKNPEIGTEWAFSGRNRRPPRDPINAMLSFGYAILAKECTVVLLAEGLDPYWGLYHQPRHGRPALALDFMEPLRPLIVDSALLTAVNTGMVAQRNFTCSHSGCTMNPKARKAFIRAYESRLDQLITHPVFDYKCSWRAALRVQARLLARWLRGDIPKYESLVTR